MNLNFQHLPLHDSIFSYTWMSEVTTEKYNLLFDTKQKGVLELRKEIDRINREIDQMGI